MVRSHALYERVGPGPLGACIGGSRIRLASTSEWLVGSCTDKRNQRFLMFSIGDGRMGLSVRVKEDHEFGLPRRVSGWRGHARQLHNLKNPIHITNILNWPTMPTSLRQPKPSLGFYGADLFPRRARSPNFPYTFRWYTINASPIETPSNDASHMQISR